MPSFQLPTRVSSIEPLLLSHSDNVQVELRPIMNAETPEILVAKDLMRELFVIVCDWVWKDHKTEAD